MLLPSAVEQRSTSSYSDMEATDPWQEFLSDKSRGNPVFRRRQIAVLGNNGRVLLTGVVTSYYEKQLAQECLRHLDGVEYIDNRLEVAYDEIDQLAVS